MDLVKEAKKSNKEAYISLVEKYSTIFYKVSRIYFTLDKEIYGSLESAILNAYHNITNIKTEKDFLSSTIKDLKNLCELKIKKNKSAYQEVDEETLLKNVKYRMYKTDSIVEKCMRSLNSDLKLPTLLYYYVNLDIKEISWITGFTKSDIKKKIALVEPQLYDILKEDANNVEDVTLFIKNKLQEDKISDDQLFDTLIGEFNSSNVKPARLSYAKQILIVIFLCLIILVVCLFFLNSYFDFINFKSNTVTNENTIIENRINDHGTLSILDKTKNEIENNTTVNQILNNSINENTSLENNVSNDISNDITNTSNSVTYANITKVETVQDYSQININDLTKFVSEFAVGMERISFEEENLESNTILLYIARHYFNTTSSKSSLEINFDYAPTTTNIHRYLTEFTGKDYSNTAYIKSFSNYIYYSNSNNSYNAGKDISILNNETYTVSDVEITKKSGNIYTATAKVIRTLDEVETNYTITFTFSINTNYMYQQFCLKSLKVTNNSFYPDNTVHLVEI